jgi:membrane protein required for colicin V production
MNFIDLIFILLLVAIMMLGFFKGMLKLLIAIVAFYLAIILSSLYYRFLGSALAGPNTHPHVSQMIAFLILIVLTFFLLLAAGLYTFRYAKIGGKVIYIDKIIGTGLGVILGVMMVSILAMILRFLFITNSTASSVNWPMMQTLQESTRGSLMVPFFLDVILPGIHLLVGPVIPDDADFIFRGGPLES